MGFVGVGLVYLSCTWLKVLISILRILFGVLGGMSTLRICADGRGLGVARFQIFGDPCSSLTLPMSGTETRHCFERSFPVGFGTVSPGQGAKRKRSMSFLWGSGWGWSLVLGVFLLPLVAIRESPEFHDIVNLDKAGWPRCLLWHGWLPALSGADDGDPWAVDAADVASKRLEVALGSYVGVSQEPGGEFFPAEGEVPLADAPDVWSDGSQVLDGFSGIGVAGCGVYAHASGAAWFGRRWRHLHLLPPLPASEACRL